MSTRGCIGVIKGGEFKVAQYCQFESFPKGLGQDIISFFKGDSDGNNIHDVPNPALGWQIVSGRQAVNQSGTHEITIANRIGEKIGGHVFHKPPKTNTSGFINGKIDDNLYKSKTMNKFFLIVAICLQLASCCKSESRCCDSESRCCDSKSTSESTVSWKNELKAEIPLLGHRNWIVVTDMAYPLQTQAGIKTVYTDAEYVDILNFVYGEIEKSPHIKAAIYQDKELLYLDEQSAKGIDALREQMKSLLGDHRTFIPHDKLIDRLDEVSRKFNVIILKSKLTVPYTSTFFELDCNYWNNEGETALRSKMPAE
jgi:hypothetical protein